MHAVFCELGTTSPTVQPEMCGELAGLLALGCACVCTHMCVHAFLLYPQQVYQPWWGVCVCVCTHFPWLPEGWEAFRGRAASKIDCVLYHGMISVVVLNLAINMFAVCGARLQDVRKLL